MLFKNIEHMKLNLSDLSASKMSFRTQILSETNKRGGYRAGNDIKNKDVALS